MNTLGTDVRFVVTSFLDGVDVLRLFSVNTTWHGLLRQERFCRLVYNRLFGACTSRDMDIFEWDTTTTWAHRLVVRCATFRNRQNGHVTNQINVPFSRVSLATCVMDGSMIDFEWNRTRLWFDIHKQTQVDLVKLYEQNTFRFHDLAIKVQIDPECVKLTVMPPKKEHHVIKLDGISNLHRMDCDPAGDLILVQESRVDKRIIMVVNVHTGTRCIIPDGYSLAGVSDRSVLYNGRLYVCSTSTGQLHCIDARTGQVTAKSTLALRHTPLSHRRGLTIGVMPHHVVVGPKVSIGDDEVKLLDADTLEEKITFDDVTDQVMDLCGHELIMNRMSVLETGVEFRWTHVDVNGKQRTLNCDFAPNELTIKAFNSRWLLMANAQRAVIYDFMPPAKTKDHGAKRFKVD